MSTDHQAITDGAVHQLDCREGLGQLGEGTVDLVFADPPFNIGYEYDVYDDRRAAEDYLDWCREWMAGVARALKPTGAFWLAIGDEFAAELKLIAQRECELHCRSWVIWYYTFGVNCVRGFSRSHTHLFHFVKNPREFTFEAEHPEARVPSARMLVYRDRRANPRGRLPDNTWVLRPQDVPDGFGESHDVWYFPRVAGTFKERQGFHGCQMPEQLLGRIIRLCSRPNELVVDPFTGSGTTLAVAKKLGRRWLGFEISPEYVERASERLRQITIGQELDGPVDPASRAPSTQSGKRLDLRVDGEDYVATTLAVGSVLAELPHQQPALSVVVDDAARGDFEERLRGKLGPRWKSAPWHAVLAEYLALEDWHSTGPRKRSAKPLDDGEVCCASPVAEIATQICEADLAKPLHEVLLDKRLRQRFDTIAAAYGGTDATSIRRAALAWKRQLSLWAQSAGPAIEWPLPAESIPLDQAAEQSMDESSRFLTVVESDIGLPLFIHVVDGKNWRHWIEQLRNAPAWRERGAAYLRIQTVPPPGWHIARQVIREVRPVLNAGGWYGAGDSVPANTAQRLLL